MEITVSHPAFQRQTLSVRTAGFFTSAAVLIDGASVKRVKGKYTLKDDFGKEVIVELKSSIVDPIPSLKVGEQTLDLAPKLAWYEYAWTGLPVVRLFVGGALGALIGMSAAFANTRIFRSNRSPLARYLITGSVSLVSAVVFFTLATLLHIGNC